MIDIELLNQSVEDIRSFFRDGLLDTTEVNLGMLLSLLLPRALEQVAKGNG